MNRKSLLFAALVLTGCGMDPQEEAFRAVLPSSQLVEVKAPAANGQALVAEVREAGQGQVSDYYKLTRNATQAVNGSTVAVLTLLDKVTQQRPTTLTEDSAVWGPHTDALSPNTWKLTVKKGGDGYEYTVEGKPKDADDSAYVAVLTGAHKPVLDAAGKPVKDLGEGQFTFNWDKAQTLPEHDDNIGRLEVHYARQEATGSASVQADFRQVKDDANPGARVDADYRYKATPGQGGEFEFALKKDMDSDASRSAKEELSIKSRWQANGAGRSDVKLSGGDLQSEATLSECWGSGFLSTYLNISFFPSAGYGNEPTDCAFTSSDFTSL